MMICEIKPDSDGVYTKTFKDQGEFTSWCRFVAPGLEIVSASRDPASISVYATVKYRHR